MSRRDADQARAALEQLGAVWSPDLDAYASGTRPASRVRCALCRHAPCDCPPFGSAAYFALTDRAHGRAPSASATCSAPGCPMTAEVGEHPAGIAIAGRDADGHHYSRGCIVEPGARGPQMCPDGCGCRLGTEDADARECACGGPCCYDDADQADADQARGPQIAQEAPREDDQP
jgi:hypothetical protein